jgi:hypothetical protein
VASSLNILFRLCNLGPGLFEGDRFNDQTPALAVTFASHLSNCSRYWASFIGLSGTFQETTGTTPAAHALGMSRRNAQQAREDFQQSIGLAFFHDRLTLARAS